MRIKITHNDVTVGGLFRRTMHEVCVRVDFTHEEKQIIRQRDLMETKIMDRRPANARDDDPDDWFELRLKHLVRRKTDRFKCATPSEAKIYEETLIDALRMVKLWLGDNADPAEGRIIEL
ncbi:hypothetical protein [Pseudohalocynthiibacter sp. F2068]|uniref:hypothetical protein n=1 Tax=Pseudohalocynthiibacter sp. F2068 TaxID=2926418 RepID=UPI001FF55832|nr:hypothetical protein [Pseudohalocynthiibacter sp. F2068]MCK0103220.1 hypothetical protein [Pseudohalocynthiibacter sp. F2068]